MTSSRRQYRMVARAESAEQTGRRIIDAAFQLFRESDPDDITLDAIAARAGVSLQTVLRRFGSKDRVFEAAAQVKGDQVARSREVDRPGDRAGAVRALVASYEEMGEVNWRLLRLEGQSPALHGILVDARARHREWLARTYADLLPRRGAERERRLDALFAATDFYVWKLYRLDLGRSRAETEAAVLTLVDSLARRFDRATRKERGA